MKLSGPLLILLLLLSIPAQAQVTRDSVDLQSRSRAAGGLPRGWMGGAHEEEEAAPSWNYRHEQAVRRVARGIQEDAQAVLARQAPRPSGQQTIAGWQKPVVPVKPDAESSPADTHESFSPDTAPAAEPAQSETTPAAASEPRPADAPIEETAEPGASESGNSAEPDELNQTVAKDGPAADYKPNFGFRVKPRERRAEEAGEAASPGSDELDSAGWPSGEEEIDPPAAPEGSDEVIEEARLQLEDEISERADEGFIPDGEAALPEPEAALPPDVAAVPQVDDNGLATDRLERPAPGSRDAEARALVPQPLSGRRPAPALPGVKAPLEPRFSQDLPVLPDYQVRSDLGKISRGSSKLKQVALTFDDGPHPQYTSQILSILDYYNAPATFFFVGVQSNKYPEWLLMARQQGHEIASQTYDHFRLPKLPKAEKEYQIDAYQDLVERITGERPRFLRPPGGQIDDDSLALMKQRGIVCAMWDVALNDTHGDKNKEELLDSTLKNVRNGSIILAHDGVQATIDMLPELIERLRERGYELVTMSQMASGL